jgi:hypothetical protein
LNERSAKIAVIVVGALVTVGVIVWRTANALKEDTTAQPAAGWSFEVISEKRAPESYRAPDAYGLESVEGLAAEKLADVTFRGTRASIDRSKRDHSDFLPIRQKQHELGANVTVKETIEDIPDDPGMARMNVSLWLLHSGPMPKDLVRNHHQLVCVITAVDPAGQAYAGGLRVGDVWAEVNETNALSTPSGEPCTVLTTASKATAVGTDVRFIVYRQGQRQELTLRKTEPLLHFGGNSFPVLDADRT